jgi:hypothetical protein
MILKRVIQSIMNNKVSFALVTIVITLIIGLLAMTIGIHKDEVIIITTYTPPNHTKSAVFWLPYYLADEVTQYLYEAETGTKEITTIFLDERTGFARTIDGTGFNFLGKYILITPSHLFIMNILYWIFISVILTGVTYLPIVRRNLIDKSYHTFESDL